VTTTTTDAAAGGLAIETLFTARLVLEPLAEGHAGELHAVLEDDVLHEFTGGRPLARDALRARFRRLESRRSPDGAETWLNWALRERDSGAAVGYVQATVRDESRVAHVAWVVGTAFQGRGYASEAAAVLVGWLRRRRIDDVRAHVHPGHAASAAVAARAGLAPTDERADGEVVWRYGERSANRRKRARSAGR
jgi:RimJ/RimL family protein N-acetyltransferase